MNPDCRDGKHAACNGDGWDDATDSPAPCACGCHHALADAAAAVDDYATLDRAIGAVLFNASNFPERVQSRLLGQNMRPLTEKLVDAVLAAGFRRVPEPSQEEQP